MEIKISPEDRLAAGPKQRNTPIFVAIVLVCGIFAGVGYKFYSDEQELLALRARLAQEAAEALAIEEAEQAAKLVERQKQRRPAPVHYDDVTSPTLEQWEREKKPEKQTIFNDQNYTPRGTVNSMAPPPARFYQTGTATRQVKQGPTVENKRAPWQWTSVASGTGGKGRTIGGQFLYQVNNGRVDTSSVCKNEDYGSLRYRDCRKGAKAYFVTQCNAGSKEACSASSMAP